MFTELEMKILDEEEAFYYCSDMERNLEGIILSHVDDFILAGTVDI